MIFGSMYVFPGAGWCITSVFNVDWQAEFGMVQPSANLSAFCCMSSSEKEFKAPSSSNRKSLMVSVLTSVFALESSKVENGAIQMVFYANGNCLQQCLSTWHRTSG